MIENNKKRKTRIDSIRNRERLLAEAKLAFAERGISASLDEIARNAGVGIGTLYRHFPNREILADEVYREQGQYLWEAAYNLRETFSAIDALDEWINLFIHYLENKLIMAGILETLNNDYENSQILTGRALIQSIDYLIGEVHQETNQIISLKGQDIVCAIGGIATYGPSPGWGESARRFAKLILIN